MHPLRILSACCAAFLLSVAPARATTITFGTTNVDHLNVNSPRVEGDFTYTATGAGWETETSFGNPGAALSTFFDNEPSAVGDHVDFIRTGGGTFSFVGLDWRTILGSNSDDVLVEGFLGVTLVNSLSLTNSSQTFVSASGFGGPIDLLRVRVTAAGGANNNAMLLDNINLSTTAATAPEPASLTLLGMGLAALRLRRRFTRV